MPSLRKNRQRQKRREPKREPVAGAPRADFVHHIFIWTILACCAALLVYSAYGFIRILRVPTDVNFGEGVVQYEAWRIARGEPIYKPIQQSPYFIGTYPPLYQLIACIGGATSLLWPRLLTLASALWCSACLFLIVRKITKDSKPAAIAGALWIISPFVSNWSVLARVDMFGRALESTAVLITFFYVASGKRRILALGSAVLFSALALLTKQNLIAGGLTCTAYLWLNRRRDAYIFIAGWIGATAFAYLVVNLVSHGWFWRNVFVDSYRKMVFQYLAVYLKWFVLAQAAWLVCAAFALANRATRASSAILACALAAAIPSIILAANDGVDRNYFFDFVWALCGLTAIAISPLLRNRFQPVLASALLLANLIYIGLHLLAPFPTDAQMRASTQILSTLKAIKKPVLAEFPGFALAVGSTPEYLPYMYRKLEDRGLFDPAPLVEKISRAEYGAILVTSVANVRWSTRILKAVQQAYVVAGEFDTFMTEGSKGQILLVPK